MLKLGHLQIQTHLKSANNLRITFHQYVVNYSDRRFFSGYCHSAQRAQIPKHICISSYSGTESSLKNKSYGIVKSRYLWSPCHQQIPVRHLSAFKDKGSGDGENREALSTASCAEAKSDSQGGETKTTAAIDAQEHEGNKAIDAPAEKRKNKLLKVIPRPRKPNPIDYSYTGNIYILPSRAMVEYLLKPSDLEDLSKYSRRSPYADGTTMTLFLRSDVEEIAVKKWGGFDQLNKEKAKLRSWDSHGAYDRLHLQSLLKDFDSTFDAVNPDDPKARAMAEGKKPEDSSQKEESFWSSGSTKVVLSAILVNGANSLIKLFAWLYTGSHSMFSEFIHSCADTMNQIILGVGLYHSFKKPDKDHPYGYRNLRNISSLISGVGVFFFGTGLSWYHCFQGFMYPQDMGSLHWCIATLIGSLISEGATLLIAISQVRKSSEANHMTFFEYLERGIEPNVTVVLLEDLAAVIGVVIAGTCISITHYTGSPVADAVGSGLIGTLLGGVACFIIYNNTVQLVGKSIKDEERQNISQLLERDRMIRSLHDIKATQMGGIVRYKAEVDFDGREITRAYLYKQDMDLLLAEAKQLETVEDLEAFMLVHGENIIDALGGEVDRIEKVLKTKHPEIRHIDLEAL